MSVEVKEVLKRNGFRFNKRYGQNFLTDENLLDGVVEGAGVTDSDSVIEIGVGAGTLTRAIAKRAKKVFGFEIDKNLQPVLSETLSDFSNVEIIFKDVMKMKTEEIEDMIGGEYKVVANLPYYITTPILMKFIDGGKNLKSITVTVQEEVADRLIANAGTENYGAITCSIDAVGNANKIIRIPRSMFYPSPNVDSAVVRIDIDRNKYQIEDRSIYRDTVRSAFQSRRKTLVNNLMMSFGFDRQTAEDLVFNIKGDVMVRGETLTTEDFVKLSKLIKKLK